MLFFILFLRKRREYDQYYNRYKDLIDYDKEVALRKAEADGGDPDLLRRGKETLQHLHDFVETDLRDLVKLGLPSREVMDGLRRRIARDVAGPTEADESQLPCGSHRLDRRRNRHRRQPRPHVYQRLNRSFDDLRGGIGDRVVRADVPVHITRWPAQRLGQAYREFAKAGKTHVAAEPDDRGLAGPALASHRGERRIGGLPRMAQHTARNTLLGATQVVEALFD